MSVIEQLNDRLKYTGTSKRRLARLSATSLTTIRSVTNGRTIPRVDTMEQMARAIGLELRLMPPSSDGRSVSER